MAAQDWTGWLRHLVPALKASQQSSAGTEGRLATPVYRFKGYDIPIDLMELTGGGPSTFDAISQAHTDNLRRWIGLEPTHTVLEIGCGIGRDAIPLTEILSEGRYVGIDIIKRSIDWCTDNIAKRHPNFGFYHYECRTSYTTRTALSAPRTFESHCRIGLSIAS